MESPGLLLAANQKWAPMPLTASCGEQFEAPQPETASLELEIFSLAQVHAVAEEREPGVSILESVHIG